MEAAALEGQVGELALTLYLWHGRVRLLGNPHDIALVDEAGLSDPVWCLHLGKPRRCACAGRSAIAASTWD
jgi:hypothetical protein